MTARSRPSFRAATGRGEPYFPRSLDVDAPSKAKLRDELAEAVRNTAAMTPKSDQERGREQ